ncbi:bifunctional adenosylcobinamide kinase/adenosylcobinamide-phosphate guanylyltransferase [Massilia sp. W12]|uniref:bifunctional adenosylcobinamide kinase/adenosylcobinamide-phosphate guanylyltransferase n=1 Tax=Massilia sp. W12 TaxID=3126507 RepID=UPI0030CF1CFE
MSDWPHCTLVLGGARSGKSGFAQNRAEALAGPQTELIYLATAQGLDSEMQARIAHHQTQRDARWRLHEEPLLLAAALQQHNQAHKVILLDCLTLWLSNALLADGMQDDSAPWRLPARYLQQRAALLDQLGQMQARVILVSNEVGMGITPLSALARCFVDEAGRLHQALAAHCAQVYWVVAGLPQCLKGAGHRQAD